MTIRERFEALQRYEGESEYAGSSVDMNPHPNGGWIYRLDVLALADKLDKELAANWEAQVKGKTDNR